MKKYFKITPFKLLLGVIVVFSLMSTHFYSKAIDYVSPTGTGSIINIMDEANLSSQNIIEATKCTDSDGGNYIFKAGILEITTSSYTYNAPEYCSDYKGTLTANGEYVQEYVCSSTSPFYEAKLTRCPTTCKDGACLPLTADKYSGCDDVCDEVCGVDGKTYCTACHAGVDKVTVAYKGKCTAGSTSTGTTSTTTCSETDSGFDVYKKGKLDANSSAGPISMTDKCVDSSYLEEYACSPASSTSIFVSDKINCQFGCKDGACLPSSTAFEIDTKCHDTDNGKDLFKKGKAYVDNSLTGMPDDVKEDKCLSDKDLLEAYCNIVDPKYPTVGTTEYAAQSCQYGCKDGACNSTPTTTTTTPKCPTDCSCDSAGNVIECKPTTSTPTCKDTDNGEDLFVEGKAYGNDKFSNNVTVYDKCLANNELEEAVCTPEGPKAVFKNCSFGCDKGACLQGELSCTDSDGGKNYFEKGSITFTSETGVSEKVDTCIDDHQLSEYICESGKYSGDKFVYCPAGCQDGACKGEMPEEPDPQVDYSKNPIDYLPPAGYEDEVLTDYINYDNPFPDLNMSTPVGRAAAELFRRGIIGGYPDGEFKKDRYVNRAELAKFLLLARFGVIDDYKGESQFPDVLTNQWYAKFVLTAAKYGIIKGHPDGKFRPANNVNTAEFLKMISLTFGLKLKLTYGYEDVKPTDWFADYAGNSEKYDLFPGRTSKLEPARTLTRGEVALAIFNFFKNR